MGCSANTQRKLAEHGGDLLNVLLTEALKLLAAADKQDGHLIPHSDRALDDLDPFSNASKLRIILKDLAHRQFLRYFQYPYNGGLSIPPDHHPGEFIQAHEDLISVVEGDVAAINNYVDNGILNDAPFPQSLKKPFCNDILSTMQTIATKDSHGWQCERFQRRYRDYEGKCKPISVNMVMIYTSRGLRAGGVLEGGSRGTSTIMYYSGIYFHSLDFSSANSIPMAITCEYPPNNYPVVWYGIPCGAPTVVNALSSFLLQASAQSPGASFSIHGTVLKVVLYPVPGSRRPQLPSPASTHVAGLTNLLREPITPNVNGDWLEQRLNRLGFRYTKTPGVSDTDLTKQIALQLQYQRITSRGYC